MSILKSNFYKKFAGRRFAVTLGDLTKARNYVTMIKIFVGGIAMKRAVLAVSVLLTLSAAVSCGNKKATIDPIEITAEEMQTAEEYKSIPTEAASAVVTESADEMSDAGEGTEFKSGTASGNVYTSEYAGIKVTFPEDTALNDRAANEKELGKIWSKLDENSKNEQGNHITDLVANCKETTYVFQYYNTKLLFPDKNNVTAEDFMEQHIAYEGNEEIKTTAPEKITLGGKEYTKETVVIDQIDLELVYYARKIDDDFILVINSQGESGFDQTVLEKSIEAI
ncbi:hypothetical protein SAMN04487860_11296 [Ruminococcus flavefaciens]|uniref:Uncharacterized protein n=2 Tax=Ruminococcus flavefaciens TaxID=1265 RepID=A0A1M7LCW0_RUMFL|nr:hypothetical protein SAMN04487860_11296 [Ruminococcus flavefaciens]